MQPLPPPQGYGQPPIPNPYQPQAASQIKKHHPWALIISLILTVLLLFGAIGFGVWAYGSRQDYKDNSDKKVAAAVEVAKKQTSDEKDKEFIEKEKSPFKLYKGPSTFASLNVTYPKTWAAFITESDKASNPVDAYFHPDWVPGTQSGTDFALRMQVTSRTYDVELKEFDSKVKKGTLKASPYKSPKVPNVLGTRVEGEINNGQQDVMILFPVRDRTLKIWTESPQFVKDLDGIIMANMTFVP